MRSLLILALLAVPSAALAQQFEPIKPAEPKAADADKKLADLEAKLQALLKEIQALRGEKPANAVRGRVIDKLVEKPAFEKKDLSLRLAPSKEGDKLTLTLDKDGKVVRQWIEKPDPNAKPGDRKSVLIVEGDTTKEVVIDAATGKIISETVKQQAKQPAGTTAAPTYTYSTTARDGGTIHLTRVTYTLSAAQAQALDTFLKQNAKASVLETKVEGDKIVVTTTPDAQGTIGQLINLMTGKTSTTSHEMHWQFAPRTTTPATPAPPPLPKAPAPPKPLEPAKK